MIPRRLSTKGLLFTALRATWGSTRASPATAGRRLGPVERMSLDGSVAMPGCGSANPRLEVGVGTTPMGGGQEAVRAVYGDRHRPDVDALVVVREQGGDPVEGCDSFPRPGGGQNGGRDNKYSVIQLALSTVFVQPVS
jgi:hypothetical protein